MRLCVCEGVCVFVCVSVCVCLGEGERVCVFVCVFFCDEWLHVHESWICRALASTIILMSR